jgi:hypothetical protein
MLRDTRGVSRPQRHVVASSQSKLRKPKHCPEKPPWKPVLDARSLENQANVKINVCVPKRVIIVDGVAEKPKCRDLFARLVETDMQ